jgi:hypothetical protein
MLETSFGLSVQVICVTPLKGMHMCLLGSRLSAHAWALFLAWVIQYCRSRFECVLRIRPAGWASGSVTILCLIKWLFECLNVLDPGQQAAPESQWHLCCAYSIPCELQLVTIRALTQC